MDTRKWEQWTAVRVDAVYTAIEKFAISKIFYVFLKEASYAHQRSICLIKNTEKKLILWNIIAI